MKTLQQDLEKLIEKYKYGLFMQDEVEEGGLIPDIYKGVIDDLMVLEKKNMVGMSDREFPKAAWLKVKYIGLIKLQGKRMWKPMYSRMANASSLFVPGFKIEWRRAWLPQAAYEMGWDSAFRKFWKR